MANLRGLYQGHEQCAKQTREDPVACAACFAQRYGDPLAERRCYFCSTDAFHRSEWGGWRMVEGHLACGQCAHRIEIGHQTFVRSMSMYRARPANELKGKAFDTYCSLKHLKDHPEWGLLLVTPMGNVLAESVRRLAREDGLPRDLLIVPAPGRTPARRHGIALVEQAARSLNGVRLGLDVLRARDAAESKTLDLASREARQPPEVIGKVRGQVIIVTDDICTSGETIARCASALLDAGAVRVYGATVARVVNPPELEMVIEGTVISQIHWSELRDDGKLCVGQDTRAVRLRFGCSGCAAVLTTRHLAAGEADARPIDLDCEECGAVHEVSAKWKNRYLTAKVQDRRASEIIVAQHLN